MIVSLLCSFHMSTNNISRASHYVLLDSHLNIHDRNDHNDESASSSNTHSHTHKHSDNEEEHTHEHFNTVSLSEILIFQSITLSLNYHEINQALPKSYNQISTEFKESEPIKPPIAS